MIRVNLLPWRAERRRAQRRHLGILAGMVAALAAAIVVLIHVVIAGYISVQEGRNDYLKKQNADLDKQIEEIQGLKSQRERLLAKRQQPLSHTVDTYVRRWLQHHPAMQPIPCKRGAETTVKKLPRLRLVQIGRAHV